jgi:large subunit ribosomal protein L21
MFAVIKSGGRQYKVSVGDTLEVNRLHVEDGEQVKIEEVLLISDANSTMIGTPFVENAMVLATAVRQARGKKIIVFKYKPKKRYRHRRGHRQELTILSIDDIVANGKSLVTGEAPKAKEAPTEELPTEERIETPPEPTELEAATGEVPETETDQTSSRRQRTTPAETTESSTEE